jgi:hypothetical protein
MDRRLGRGLWVLFGVCALAGSARAQSSEIFDPAGDVDRKGEPYLDVVEGKISRLGNRFVVQMQVAAPLPAQPPSFPGSDGWTIWEMADVDLDPALAPRGWPFTKNDAFGGELPLMFVADGVDYFAQLVDRRPLADGGAALIFDSRTSDAIKWRVTDGTIEVEMDAALWGSPTEFMWRNATLTVNSLGSGSTTVLDFGTDPPFSLVPWPG